MTKTPRNSKIAIAFYVVLVICIVAAFFVGKHTNKSEPPPVEVAHSDTLKAITDAEKAANAADQAAVSARKAADSTRETAQSAEDSAKDTADSAKAAQEFVNKVK